MADEPLRHALLRLVNEIAAHKRAAIKRLREVVVLLDSCGNLPMRLNEQGRRRLEQLNRCEDAWRREERDLDARFKDLVSAIATRRPRWDVLNGPVGARNEVAVAGNAVDAELAIARMKKLAGYVPEAMKADQDGPAATPLSEREQEVDEFIREYGPKTSREIARGTGIGDDVLRNHVIPALKRKRGLQNKRSRGYYYP